MRKYPYELDTQVVESFFEGESAIDLTEKFEVSNRRRIYDWVKMLENMVIRHLKMGLLV